MQPPPASVPPNAPQRRFDCVLCLLQTSVPPGRPRVFFIIIHLRKPHESSSRYSGHIYPDRCVFVQASRRLLNDLFCSGAFVSALNRLIRDVTATVKPSVQCGATCTQIIQRYFVGVDFSLAAFLRSDCLQTTSVDPSVVCPLAAPRFSRWSLEGVNAEKHSRSVDFSASTAKSTRRFSDVKRRQI